MYPSGIVPRIDGRCARGDWCRGRVIIEGTVLPAESPRSFCDPCAGDVGARLGELPGAWARAAVRLGIPVSGGTAVRVPFGPRLPPGLAPYDELMREIAEVVLGWGERVRVAARLSHVDRTLGHQAGDIHRAIRDTAILLGGRLSVLLALDDTGGEAEMYRFITPGSSAEPVRLGGDVAGLEILGAHRRALRVLGEVRAPREVFDGVPCKSCGDTAALERAEPPSDPAREAMWSRCAGCQATMTRKQFGDWAKWYAGWADKAGLTCRRCVLGRHDQCAYDSCMCLTCSYAREHAGRAA